MGKLKNPLLVYIGFAIFFIVGVVMLVFGFISLITALSYKQTTATVVSVRTYINEEGSQIGVPTYEYYVDGERYEYESYGRSVSLCPLVGDTVKIRYNKDNPSKTHDNTVITVVFFIFGVVFGGVGATMFVLSAMGKIHWTSARSGRHYYREDRDVLPPDTDDAEEE